MMWYGIQDLQGSLPIGIFLASHQGLGERKVSVNMTFFRPTRKIRQILLPARV